MFLLLGEVLAPELPPAFMSGAPPVPGAPPVTWKPAAPPVPATELSSSPVFFDEQLKASIAKNATDEQYLNISMSPFQPFA